MNIELLHNLTSYDLKDYIRTCNHTNHMNIELLHELTSYDLWLFLGERRVKLESKYDHKFFINIYCIQDQIIKNKSFTKILISSNSIMNWLQMTYKTTSWSVITMITWISKSFMNWYHMVCKTASGPVITLITWISNSIMNWYHMVCKTAAGLVTTLITWILNTFLNWLHIII